jgi:CheY-specific phosphatase CheX
MYIHLNELEDFIMSARIISTNKESVTIEVTIELSKSLLKSEEAILEAVNSVGNLATGFAITQFDTDGTPIVIGTEKWTSKGQIAKISQTPYGDIEVARHVYQNFKGGQTYCPLDCAARIVVTSTPYRTNGFQ